MPVLDVPEEAQPSSGLSEAQKAEKKKAKKARQRAARAQVTAQIVEVSQLSAKLPKRAPGGHIHGTV